MSPTAEATVGQARDRELITRALRRLRRRVVVQRFFDHAAFDLAAALLLFLLVLAADRVAAPGLASFGLFGLFLLAAAAVSAARTFLFRFPSLFQAAVLADRRLELKERVASALYARELLGAGETGCRGETGRWGTGGVLAFHADLGWLLEREAAAALERAALAERFPFRLPRRAALAALALLLANGMLALWLPSYDLFGIARREAAKKELQLSVEEKKKELDRRLAELAEQAEEKRTPEAKKLLELLRAQAVEQEKKKEENAGAQSTPGEKEPGDPQKQAMVELGRREEEIKKGLQGEKFDKLKDSLKALEKLGLREAKLTRKLASALKEGNFEKAKQELDSLRDDFEKLSRKESSQLTPAEKERLEALARELERLAKESNSLDRLGRELAKAGASMSAKDFPQAFQGLDAAGNELESLASLASEMDLLDQALELVRMSKDDMARICPQCGTPYCPDCGKPQCACKPGQKPGGT